MEWKTKLVRLVLITWFVYALVSFFANGSLLSPLVLDQIIVSLIGLLFLVTSFNVKHIWAYLSLVLGFVSWTLINEQVLLVFNTYGISIESLNKILNYKDELAFAGLLFFTIAFIYHTVLVLAQENRRKGIVIGLFYLVFLASTFFENNYTSEFGILLASLPTTIICLRSDSDGVSHLFYLTWLLVSGLTILRLFAMF